MIYRLQKSWWNGKGSREVEKAIMIVDKKIEASVLKGGDIEKGR